MIQGPAAKSSNIHAAGESAGGKQAGKVPRDNKSPNQRLLPRERTKELEGEALLLAESTV